MGSLLAGVILLLFALPVWGLSLTVQTPAGTGSVPLLKGAQWHGAPARAIVGIPPALSGGTLLVTPAAGQDAVAWSFSSDKRCEVYLCREASRAAATWLDSWVKTEMVVEVEGGSGASFVVWARRFPAGPIVLPAPEKGEERFVVVRESELALPRRGWVFLSDDRVYLREMITRAPDFGINTIQLSHEIVHNTVDLLDDPARRAKVNELIDLAHAYGVPEVLLWSHEICDAGMPPALRAPAGHPAAGHADGNNPALWSWVRGRYEDLFNAGTGCPEADGVVLTFSETSDRVYAHEPGQLSGVEPGFKHDGFTPAQSVAQVINTIQQVLGPRGKLLYARTWGDSAGKREEAVIRDGIRESANTAVWMMNKNVGGIDWPFMDRHQPLIGTLPSGFHELIEFDLGFEYFDRNRATACLTWYLKDHWNFALSKGAQGAVARVDRGGGMAWYGANRLNIYAFSEIIGHPDADPRQVTVEICRRLFPAGAAEELAEAYADPSSGRPGATRYLTWKAYFPKLAPLDATEAKAIGQAALARIERRRPELTKRVTLNTREGVDDYVTLREGIALPLRKLGVTVPFVAPPWAPIQLQANALSSLKVRLTWRMETPGAKTFRIERRRGTEEWSLVGTVEAATTAYVDNEAPGNGAATSYAYRVAGCNAFGCSSTLETAVVPFRPLELKAAAGVGREVVLTWRAGDSLTSSFRVQRRPGGCASAASWVSLGVISARTRLFRDTTVTAGRLFAYRVKAEAAGPGGALGLSDDTDCVEVTP